MATQEVTRNLKSLHNASRMQRDSEPDPLIIGECIEAEFVHTLVCRSGIRISEVLGLKWKDVDWLGKTLSVERGIVKQIQGDVKTKTSAKKMVIDDDQLEVLKQWKQATQFSEPEGCFFASPSEIGRQPLSYTFVWETLSDAAIKAGMAHVSSHVFRHTYRTWLDSVGTPVGVSRNSCVTLTSERR